MKLRHAMMSLALVMAAGCDTMEQDVDGSVLSINNDPAYFLPNSDGFIDLAARVVSPGRIRVEITTSTRHGELTDLGKGLLQYSPFKGSGRDSFRFRVLSDDNRVLGEDSIGIIIPTDTTTLPCKYVYTRNDTVWNVAGPVTIDVILNDYSCSGSLTILVNVAPEHGTATIVGNKIRYVPNNTFAGRDQILYKASSSNTSLIDGYAWLRIFGADSVGTDTTHNDTTHIDTTCWSRPKNDLFFKPLNDSSLMYLNVLANDSICSDSTITITQFPTHGTAFVNNGIRKIGYRNPLSSNINDTLLYRVGPAGNGVARVIIKRQ